MTLLDDIRHLARRRVRIHAAAGVAWGLIAAVAVVAAGVWFDLLWELSALLRIGNVALAAATFLGGAGLAVWLGWLRAAPERIAQRLDRVGETGGLIRAGVDLALRPPSGSDLTHGLADLAIEKASRRIETIPSADVVPARPAFRAWVAAVALGTSLVFGAWVMPRLVDAEWLRWTDPFGDHPPYSRVIYQSEPGAIRVPYGASVDIRVRVEEGTVDKLDLLLLAEGAAGPEKMAMFPEGPGQWRATLTSVLTPGVYWVRSVAGRSRKFPIDVITVPELQEVRFRIEPPAYTHLPPYEGPLPQGGLTGLPGTKVRIWAKSNRPLAGGRLVFIDDKSEVALDPVAPASQEATGVFELRRPGKALLHMLDADGQRSAPPFAVPMQIVTDEPPRVRIVEPPALSVATPTAAVPVTVAADDDFGVAKLILFRSLNDSRPLGTREKLPAVAPTRTSATALLPLSAFGLAPGDEIKLHGRAEDADPAGPNAAESPPVVIKIISQEEFNRMVAARNTMEMLLTKYRQAERRMENLKDDVDRLRKKAKAAPAEAREELAKELMSLAEQFRKDADELNKWLDKDLQNELDAALRKHLEKTGRELMRLGERAAKMAQSTSSPSEWADDLEGLLRDLLAQEDELNREAVLPLEQLAAMMPLLEDASRLELVYRRQKALVLRLEDLAKTAPPKDAPRGRYRDPRDRQESIRKLLTSIVDDLEDHLAALDPAAKDLDEFRDDVRKFLEDLRTSKVIDVMAEAEKHLDGDDLERGLAAARKALELLEKLLENNDLAGSAAMGQGAGGRPRFAPGLGQTIRQAIGRMLAQRGLGPPGGQGDGSSRQPLDNIGLYGGAPRDASSTANRAGRGDASKSGQPGGASRHPGNTSALPAPPTAGAQTPAGDVVVPQAYRRRVADYFQRVADETR